MGDRSEAPREKRKRDDFKGDKGRSKKPRRGQKGDQSRKTYLADSVSRRVRVDETREKVARLGEGRPIWADEFREEEIRDEPRRPKHRLALIFGYAGTGYHGSQIERTRKTIEGDLWRACVRAGMISKANCDDPKKISWVRCSRTDRNVHAAANVVSANLIDEDHDVVERVNQHLPEQIRLWGFEKLNKSFNAHQRCEARIYQYWIPTFCFLPPHPSSYLGSQLRKIAEESGNASEYEDRQAEVAGFWEKAEAEYAAPALQDFDQDVIAAAREILFETGLQNFKASQGAAALEKPTDALVDATAPVEASGSTKQEPPVEPSDNSNTEEGESELVKALRAIKEAHKAARYAYRIDEKRLERVRASIKRFGGTHDFWNFTEQKRFGEASAKRFMQSCTADEAPIVVNGTEWLPLKLHGQSFMIHQIRKMVTMVAMTVRCGSSLDIISDTFGPTKLNVPKAPPTGLLLERPVFDAYNKSLDHMQPKMDRGRLEFDQYHDRIEAFKRQYIVEPMHATEQREGVYHNFFVALDSLRSAALLYFSSRGLAAVEETVENSEQLDSVLLPDEGQDDDDGGDGQGGDDDDTNHGADI